MTMNLIIIIYYFNIIVSINDYYQCVLNDNFYIAEISFIL